MLDGWWKELPAFFVLFSFLFFFPQTFDEILNCRRDALQTSFVFSLISSITLSHKFFRLNAPRLYGEFIRQHFFASCLIKWAFSQKSWVHSTTINCRFHRLVLINLEQPWNLLFFLLRHESERVGYNDIQGVP